MRTGSTRTSRRVDHFGWQVDMRQRRQFFGVQRARQGQLLDVGGIVLTGVENSGPSFHALANNLYYQAGRYIRGAGWPLNLDATDDSGVCGESASIDGRLVDYVQPLTPNTSGWLQCGNSPTREMGGTFDAGTLANGPHTLVFSARNAAGVTSTSNSSTFLVDNTPPTVALSGPDGRCEQRRHAVREDCCRRRTKWRCRDQLLDGRRSLPLPAGG